MISYYESLIANRAKNANKKLLLTSRLEITMRFMILIKATADSEAGVMPSERLLAEMGKFNEGRFR